MGKRNNIPDEFRQFCQVYFHEDVSQTYGSHEAAVADFIRMENRDRQAVVRSYLNELLDSDMDQSDLEEIWLNAGAGIYVFGRPNAMRKFFQMIYDSIEP